MAKDSEPRARPITVSELIARSETSGSAFPKSASEEDRRNVRRAGASGMPSHSPAEPAPAESVRPDDQADNAVTGIIPVVRDESSDDTQTLEPIPADDPVGVDLPPIEYRGTDTAAYSATGRDDVDESPASYADGAPTAYAYADADDHNDGEDGGRYDDYRGNDDRVNDDRGYDSGGNDDDGSGRGESAIGHRRIASSADLAAAQEAEDEAAAEETERTRADAKKSKRDKDSHEPSAVVGWLTLVAEAVLGLAVGAGLFWGFTELWKRYVYLALILAVVVIFAIVTFAHVLRKRDLPTTLMALGVGMLVTIGPLVLLAA